MDARQAVHYQWDVSPEVLQMQRDHGVDQYGRTVHNLPGVPAEKLNAELNAMEELPGYDPDEVLSKPHRELSFEECERYGLPQGSVILATPEEIARGGQINPIPAPKTDMEPAAQIQQFYSHNGLQPWSGAQVPTFAHSGDPVPSNLLAKNGIFPPNRQAAQGGSARPQHAMPFFSGAQDRAIYRGAH